MDLSFFITNLLLGVGLAMDAFSVSLANGLNEPRMRTRRACGIAGIFALFQGLMPMLGWLCIHTVVECFQAFERLIPWIALAILGYIGGKMLYEGITATEETAANGARLGFSALLIQGVATSIDALSVGFTIAEYDALFASVAALLIALVTFVICLCGILIGRQMGTRLAGKAGILGGSILILIGLWICIKSFL